MPASEKLLAMADWGLHSATMAGYKQSMSLLPRLLVSSVLLLGLSGAGQQAPRRMIEISDADRATLDKVSTYLNGIRTLTGSFMQIGPNGEVAQGRFALAKPGRVRFEYDPPTPTLIVSDGRRVAVQNKKLNTVDRYSLSDTGLDVILADNIDLRHNKAVMGVSRQSGTLVIQLRSDNHRAKSNLTLVLAEPSLELRQWTILDPQGLATTIALRDLQPGVEVSDRLFVLPQKEKRASN